jgi:hypothetical protein
MGSCRLTLRAVFLLPASFVVSSYLALFALSCPAYGQASYPDQEIHIHDLPTPTARTPHASDVLAASLEIIFKDKEVCCGKDSALEDSVQSADPKSLKDIAGKLQGRHLLSDGRPIMVTAEYLTPDQVSAGHLIYMLAANHAPLMLWDLHLYVVDGASYVETIDPDGGVYYVTHKFFLQDTRFSDSRREVTFDRVTEDGSKVQGLLFLRVEPQ